MRRLIAGAPALTAVAVAVSCFFAAHPALRAYRVPSAALMVALAAICSAALTYAVTRWLRQPALVSYLASLLGLLMFLLLVSGPHPDRLAHQLVQGPDRLLTETLPLTGSPASLALLISLTWLAAAAASEMLIRLPGSAVGLAPPVVLFVVAYAASEAGAGQDPASGPALLAALTAIALVRYRDAGRAAVTIGDPDRTHPSPHRALLFGAFGAGLIAVGLALTVPHLPSMSGRPAALHHGPPTVAPIVIDPLDVLADLRDGDPHAAARQMMTVRLSRPAPGYAALAVLDDYDGGGWRFDATFQPTGGRVPRPGGAPAVEGSVVGQRVTVNEPLPVPMLPVVDRPLTVKGLAVTTDAVTGMILPAAPLPVPFTYAVDSITPVAGLRQLPPADGVDVTASPRDLALPQDSTPDLATALRFIVTVTRQRPAPTLAFLQSVLDGLQANDRRIDPSLPMPAAVKGPASRSPSPSTPVQPAGAVLGGVSLSEVINAVTVNRAATPEQFATLFAMIARYLGVPARVVSGFRIAPAATSGLVATGTYRVTNRQAWAWVEIPVSGLGWVVADPTPDLSTAVSSPPPEQVQASATTLAPGQANALPSNAAGGHALARPAATGRRGSPAAPPWLVGTTVAGLLVLVLALAGPGQAALRRLWRRRARRARLPDELAVGAWLELLDGLERVGLVPEAGWTSADVAREAGLAFGSDVATSVRAVGVVADRAVFCQSDVVLLDDAVGAWSAQRAVFRAARAGLDRRQRVRAWLTVGRAPRSPRRDQ